MEAVHYRKSTVSRSLHRHGSAGPWVTSVGGTAGHDPEFAASLSGGGFSDYFERPDYQEVAVPAFLRNPDRRPELDRFYKCVFWTTYSDPTFSYFVNFVVWEVGAGAASPTFPRRRTISLSSGRAGVLP